MICSIAGRVMIARLGCEAVGQVLIATEVRLRATDIGVAQLGDGAWSSTRYVEQFGTDQVRIVRFEQWVRYPRATYLALMDFLGLDDDGQADFPQVNAAHDHRFKALANMTQRPPRLASKLSQVVRSIPGMAEFRPARLLRKLNRSEGYRKPQVDTHLRETIATHYREDQALLNALYQQVGLVLTDPVSVVT